MDKNNEVHTYKVILGASLVAQTVKICLQCMRPRFNAWVRKIPWRREWLPYKVILISHQNNETLDFPGGPVTKNPPANARDMGSIPGL